MRVLHCIYDDPANPWVGGGGAVRVLEIYRRLRERLGRVTVATGAYPGAPEGEIEGLSFLRLGAVGPYAWSRLTYGIEASRLLATGEYDAAVYDFSTYTPVWVPKARPVGTTVHHITGDSALDRWGSIRGHLIMEQELRRLRRGRLFSATSRSTLQQLRARVGPEAEIHLIEAGVSDELFSLPHREADYILFFGRLDWFQKGLDVLLEAMRMLVQSRPDLRLRIAGRGKDRELVVNRSYELGIRENVEVLGPVGEDIRNDLFAGARVLVMPSRFEGFGMVAAEAMAAGVPIVAASSGSLPEVVGPANGGVLVPPEDAVALAEAIEALLADPRQRREQGRRAREAAERYRWDRIAHLHLRFLEAIHERGAWRPDHQRLRAE